MAARGFLRAIRETQQRKVKKREKKMKQELDFFNRSFELEIASHDRLHQHIKKPLLAVKDSKEVSLGLRKLDQSLNAIDASLHRQAPLYGSVGLDDLDPEPPSKILTQSPPFERGSSQRDVKKEISDAQSNKSRQVLLEVVGAVLQAYDSRKALSRWNSKEEEQVHRFTQHGFKITDVKVVGSVAIIHWTLVPLSTNLLPTSQMHNFIEETLQKLAGPIRFQLGERLQIRRIPKVQWKYEKNQKSQ